MDSKGLAQHTWRFSVAIITLVVYVHSGEAFAAEKVKLVEAMLPANVPFVVASDDLAATSTAWQATQLGQILCGESFVPVRQAAAKQNAATLLYLRPCFGFDWGDLSSHAGPAVFAIVPLKNGEVGLAWIFPKSKQSADKLLAAGRAHFKDRDYVGSDETSGGAQITVFTPPAKYRASYRPTYIVSESVAVAATTRNAAVAIWKQFNGPARSSLGSVKDFTDLAATSPEKTSGPLLRWWLRPLDLWTALRGKSRPPRPDWLAIARRQGGESIRAIGGEIAFPTSGSTDLDLRGRTLLRQPLTKAAKLLDFWTAPPLAIPRWLDSDVAGVSLWGCSMPEAVTAFGHLFDEINEPGPSGEGCFQEMLAALRDDPEGPKVDLLRDLFPHLGPSVLQTTDCLGHDGKGKAKTRRTLYVVQCQDRATVVKTLKRFYAGDKDIHERTVDKGTLWTIGEGRSLLFEGSDQSVALVRVILVADKTVVFATHPEMLTGLLSGRARAGLAESPGYKAVAKWWQASKSRGARDAGFVQLRLWLEPSYDAVRSRTPTDDWAAALLRLVLTGSHEASAAFPVEQLPEFAKFGPLLPPLGSLREKNAAGWDIKMSTPRELMKKP